MPSSTIELPEHPKIDVHTHILPENWPNLAERYGYGGFVQLVHHQPGCAQMTVNNRLFREINENCWSAEVRLRECEEHGVDLQVLSTVPVMFSYWARPDDTYDLSRMLNDHMASVVRAHPDRFVGLGTLPMQDPELAIRELERCVKELGLLGIEIGSHVNDWNLYQPELFPVFRAAEQLEAAVFVHPWDMMGKDKMTKYWLPWLVGMPAESSLAICSMIFGGIFERLPDLKVCFAHGGGSFPSTLGRIEHAFHVRPELCAVDNDVNPREYLGRFYLDTLVHDSSILRFLIDQIGSDYLALGTDYPFPLGELQPGRLIESLDELSPEVKHRLLGGTAMDWLRIERAV